MVHAAKASDRVSSLGGYSRFIEW